MSKLDALGVRVEVEEMIALAIAEAFRRREPPKRWLSVAEAAAYLGITEVAVRSRMKRGRVPLKHHGRSVLIDRVALDREIEEAA